MGEKGQTEIREAHDDELDIVASLCVDAYAEYAASMSPDAWSTFAQDIANVRGRTVDAQQLVAVRHGRIVGSVTLYLPWKGAQEGSASVRLLAVPPDQRGTALGRELMRACIDRARGAGSSRVVLTVTQEMEQARDLYESMGFARAPELDHEPAPGVRFGGYALALDDT